MTPNKTEYRMDEGSKSLQGTEESSARLVQSVQRAMRLLNAFAYSGMGPTPHRTHLSVTDLARQTGLHKSVVARLLATMAREGFLSQDPVTKTYCVGPQAFAVGSAYEPRRVLEQIARPVMEDLTSRGGHASYLGVAAGDHYVTLLGVENPQALRETANTGEMRPYHANAIGKVLLAGMTDEEIRAILGTSSLPKLTAHTIDSVDRLLLEIQEVRRTGFAYIHGESAPGASSVAVPIRNQFGQCVAGLAVLYPTVVVTESGVEEMRHLISEAAATISHRLGNNGTMLG